MTVRQAAKQLLFQLYHIYDEREADNVADLVMENVTEWKRIDRVMNKDVVISREKENLLNSYIEQLLQNKPVQYVLHEAWFAGMNFYVDENVLIPRPETEELVDWVCKDERSVQSDLNILDVGTGSGCIAITIKKKLPGATIVACDTSEGALSVASRNAGRLHQSIDFRRCDFLVEEERKLLPPVQVIVSNPPYIPVSDKAAMHSNVVEHEPHLALFVDNNNPLVFYEAIADFSLSGPGKTRAVYVEIHEQMADAVSLLFEKKGFKNIELKQDLQGKNRMLKASM